MGRNNGFEIATVHLSSKTNLRDVTGKKLLKCAVYFKTPTTFASANTYRSLPNAHIMYNGTELFFYYISIYYISVSTPKTTKKFVF